MAMGRRERGRQQEIFIETTGLRTAGHPFYQRLNGKLNEYGFDDFVEQLCATFYDEKQGRPSIAPGVYFRIAADRLLRRDRLGAMDCLAEC